MPYGMSCKWALGHVCANNFKVNFSSAEPCSEVSGSWYGRLSQCCGILVADFVFITKLVQVSSSRAYSTHSCTFLDIFGHIDSMGVPGSNILVW